MSYPNYYMYPAVFQPDGNMWTVTFPDLDNAFTSADSLEEAIIDAQAVLEDCMYFREEHGDEIPVPSKLTELVRPEDGLVQMVVAVMRQVRYDWGGHDAAFSA